MGRQIVARVGRLVAAAQQAALEDPAIAAEIAQWREQTRTAHRHFWTAMRSDGLIPAGADLDWLTDTAAVLCGPDTYVLVEPSPAQRRRAVGRVPVAALTLRLRWLAES